MWGGSRHKLSVQWYLKRLGIYNDPRLFILDAMDQRAKDMLVYCWSPGPMTSLSQTTAFHPKELFTVRSVRMWGQSSYELWQNIIEKLSLHASHSLQRWNHLTHDHHHCWSRLLISRQNTQGSTESSPTGWLLLEWIWNDPNLSSCWHIHNTLRRHKLHTTPCNIVNWTFSECRCASAKYDPVHTVFILEAAMFTNQNSQFILFNEKLLLM